MSESARYTIGGIAMIAITVGGFVGYLIICLSVASSYDGERIVGWPVLVFWLSLCVVIYASFKLGSRVRKLIIAGDSH